jgi:hypothetical protein
MRGTPLVTQNGRVRDRAGMADEKFLAVKNWEKYQTGRGKMRWIKIETHLEDDTRFRRLTVFQQGLLMNIWRLRGRTARNVPNDPKDIARALCIEGKERHCLPQAIRVLVASDFLVPTNQEVDSLEEIRKEEIREEQNTTSAPSEPVVERPKIEKVKIVISPPKIFELPPWVHQATWMDYELMRKKLGKPMTDRARELILRKLEGLMNRGHPPQEVLEQSIENSWQGLFEVKDRNGRQNNHGGETTGRSAADILRERDDQQRRGLAELRANNVLGSHG